MCLQLDFNNGKIKFYIQAEVITEELITARVNLKIFMYTNNMILL